MVEPSAYSDLWWRVMAIGGLTQGRDFLPPSATKAGE
jgi:hypothetical protein